MTRATLRATILGCEGKRIEVRCYHEGERYVWRADDGMDMEMSQSTVAAAKQSFRDSYCVGGGNWQPRATWL